MPTRLAEIVDEFAAAPRDLVLEMLLEYADVIPPLPAENADREGMEQVPECQTSFFLHARVTPEKTVETLFDCPPEAPTTRAFAGILAEGLEGASPALITVFASTAQPLDEVSRRIAAAFPAATLVAAMARDHVQPGPLCRRGEPRRPHSGTQHRHAGHASRSRIQGYGSTNSSR